MTRIALLRHFPTDWNRENRLQGQIDRPLLPESRERLAGLALPPPWDRTPILASTLSRSRDTAASLSAGRPVTEDPRLVEISWGDWEGCLGEDLLADPVSDYVPIEQWGWSRRPPNGESPADAWARIAPVLAEIAEASPTLLIIHRAIMRVILA
ncbi:MAG: histidine phosphatase family protein, partial [Pseudomonadota bacterium]